jgi:hypothetical protein
MEVTEVSLAIRALWFRIQRQILVLSNVEVANNLGVELQYLQWQMLGVLQSRLQELTAKIDKLANASVLRRCVDPARISRGSCHGDAQVEMKLTDHHNRKVTYAIYMKDSLKDSMKELETWYSRWDPSWFLIARLVAPSIDLAIHEQRVAEDPSDRRSLTILDDLRNALRPAEGRHGSSFKYLPTTVVFGLSNEVKYSTVSKAIRLDTYEAVLIETIPYRENTSSANLQNDIEKLVRVLSTMDPRTCNVLTCAGVQKISDTDGQLQGFSVLFKPPIMEQFHEQTDTRQKLDVFDDQVNLSNGR